MTETGSRLRGETSSALEKGFARVVTPFEQFIRDQKTASVLLLASILIALIIANSPLADQYEAFVKTRIGFVLGVYGELVSNKGKRSLRRSCS